MTVFTQEFYALKEQYRQDHEYRNRMGNCQLCGQNIKDRSVALYQGLIDCLYKVYCFCGEKRVHEFRMKDIKHLLGKNEYARFGDLIRFGGLVYKPKGDTEQSEKAFYGLNMERCKEFFSGQREIPVQITLNQLTNEILDAKYVKVGNFPELSQMLTAQGFYDYQKII